jgi:hypothetical protein
MKQIRPLISGLVACGIALSMVASLSAQTAQQGLAKVVNIKGSARYMLSGANATWQPLKTGIILKSGTVLQTAADSYADLVLNNPNASGSAISTLTTTTSTSDQGYQPKIQQDVVRVFENSVLAIDSLTIDQTGVETITETKLDLKAGSIFGMVKKLTTGSKYEVKIPNGVAGIRGTVYSISAAGILRVMHGSVVLAYTGTDASVATKVVNTGQQFDAHTGQLTAILPKDDLRPQLPNSFLPSPTYNGPGRGGSGGPVIPIYVSPTK